jgi:hypothetical protein
MATAMNTPIGHRVTDLRGTINQLRIELGDANPAVAALLDSIEKQMDGLDGQLRIDREEAAQRVLDRPGYIDTSTD